MSARRAEVTMQGLQARETEAGRIVKSEFTSETYAPCHAMPCVTLLEAGRAYAISGVYFKNMLE